MNLLPSVVHVSSTFEFGAPQKLLHNAVRQFSILHFFFGAPRMSLASAVHASSTFESGALQSYCVALFANFTFSTFFRSPVNVIA